MKLLRILWSIYWAMSTLQYQPRPNTYLGAYQVQLLSKVVKYDSIVMSHSTSSNLFLDRKSVGTVHQCVGMIFVALFCLTAILLGQHRAGRMEVPSRLLGVPTAYSLPSGSLDPLLCRRMQPGYGWCTAQIHHSRVQTLHSNSSRTCTQRSEVRQLWKYVFRD